VLTLLTYRGLDGKAATNNIGLIRTERLLERRQPIDFRSQ
jgi:hypothetical protein